MENSMEVLQKKKKPNIRPCNSTPGYLSEKKQKTVIWKDTCTPILIAFTIAKIWKQPKCPLTGEWIKKMWYIQTQ